MALQIDNNTKSLTYLIALSKVNGIGPILAKNLISYCGSAEAVFKESKKKLIKIPQIGNETADAIINSNHFEIAQAEIEFNEKHGIKTLAYYDNAYPKRLLNNMDAPLFLNVLGNTDLNEKKIIGIVGTRKPTDYGIDFCEKMIEALQDIKPIIVSGLAYGIDIQAHKSCIKYQIPTVAVLAHGLDMVYPNVHKKYAKDIIKYDGALVTEFTTSTIPDKENFPKRNRIVAGMIDALVVIETAIRGGSMITAELAYQYDRNVLALPGRSNDIYSAGCNYLIKNQKAEMLESSDDLLKSLNWDLIHKKKPIQNKLALDLKPNEDIVFKFIKQHEMCTLDQLIIETQLSSSILALTLLDLEFANIIKALPGKAYKLL